jgi:alkylation response protein AidB-like acyl-CoA dehydrogenase
LNLRQIRYYNETHHTFRANIREFVDREIRPTAINDDATGKLPSLEINKKLAESGILSCLVAAEPSSWAWGLPLPGRLDPVSVCFVAPHVAELVHVPHMHGT